MITSDFHVHTTYCDGRNTPEEMVRAAVAHGLTEIGFTGHALTSFDTEWCMSENGTKEYIAELKRLRNEYADRISIHIGSEYDYYSDGPTEDMEYLIGSVHYIEHNGVRRSIDDSPEIFAGLVNTLYDGDYLACAEDYYENVAVVINRTHADIIGHFDLITKFNEGNVLFDTFSERYRKAWMQAADSLLATGRVFEINTGAISRGYRTSPYPAAEIIDYIGERGGTFILSSDSHSTDTLLYRFNECGQYILQHGYRLISSFSELKAHTL